MTNRHIDQICKETGPALRPLLQRAFDAGRKAERARILNVLETEEGEESLTTPIPPSNAKPKRKRGGKPGLRAGSMNDTVLKVIKAMPPPHDDVDANAVYKSSISAGHGISIIQVRTALKVLTRMNHLVRLELGKYALKDEAPASNGADAPVHNGVEGGTSSSSGGEERPLFEAPPGASPAKPGR